jgi:O-antigen/teichoic acid export membrane protein
MFQRILKMLGALATGIGINVIAQLLLPPVFLHYYGVNMYGEWLVLSSTLSYLSTLNFGITTYASNELTMLRKRGDIVGYTELQGSTLALLLVMIGIGLVACSAVFVIPLGKLLHLTTLTQTQVALTAFFLGLQTIVNILAGYYNSLFMVVQETHRGLTWMNARSFAGSLAGVALAMMKVDIPILALGQFLVAVILTVISIYDLKGRMGDLSLSLRGATRKTARATLAPSGMFAMIFAQQFLTFQAPIVMLQWILGPEIVVLFSVSRTVLSTARQALSRITSAIAPEITLSFADRDMPKLLKIFHFSEKIVFAGIPIANMGAYLFSPILLQIWLHKPQLFNSFTYGLMALISGAMSMREHKQFFQFSTNTHKLLSIIVFFGNLLMIAGSIPFTMKFGLNGFMCVWLVSELCQMALIYLENKKLFDNHPSISFVPVLKLAAVMMVSLPVCAWLIKIARQRSLTMLGVVAVVGLVFLCVECYFVFGLRDVLAELVQRMRRGKSLTVNGVT